MMSLTFGLFTQVSGSGPLGPLVYSILLITKVHAGKQNFGKCVKINTNNACSNFNEL